MGPSGMTNRSVMAPSQVAHSHARPGENALQSRGFSVVLIDRELSVEQFDYGIARGDWTALRLLASLGPSLGRAPGTHLVVELGLEDGDLVYAPARDGLVERRLLGKKRGSELLWNVTFDMPVEVVQAPRALFRLVADDGAALTLPTPWQRDLSPAPLQLSLRGERRRSAPRIALRAPRRIAALGTAVALTGTSAPALALAAGVAGTGAAASVAQSAGSGTTAFALDTRQTTATSRTVATASPATRSQTVHRRPPRARPRRSTTSTSTTSTSTTSTSTTSTSTTRRRAPPRPAHRPAPAAVPPPAPRRSPSPCRRRRRPPHRRHDNDVARPDAPLHRADAPGSPRRHRAAALQPRQEGSRPRSRQEHAQAPRQLLADPPPRGRPQASDDHARPAQTGANASPSAGAQRRSPSVGGPAASSPPPLGGRSAHRSHQAARQRPRPLSQHEPSDGWRRRELRSHALQPAELRRAPLVDRHGHRRPGPHRRGTATWRAC